MFPNHPYRYFSSPSKKGDFQFPQVNLSFYCNLLTVADFCIPSSVFLDQVILFLWLLFCTSCFVNLFLCLLPPPGVPLYPCSNASPKSRQSLPAEVTTMPNRDKQSVPIPYRWCSWSCHDEFFLLTTASSCWLGLCFAVILSCCAAATLIILYFISVFDFSF